MKTTKIGLFLLSLFLIASLTARAEDHSHMATLIKGGRHHPASIAWACLWGQTIAYRKNQGKNGKDSCDIAGHEFWSKPAFVTRNGKELIITGELSHIRNGGGWKAIAVGQPQFAGQKDDQLRYEIHKVDGKVTSITKEITVKGGYHPIVGPQVEILNLILNTKLDPAKIEEFARKSQEFVQGKSWEVAADAIIINIGVYAS